MLNTAFSTSNDTDAGEERGDERHVASISQPQNELERLITELSESENLVFVFGVGRRRTPARRRRFSAGRTDKRWWHVELGEDTATWSMGTCGSTNYRGSVSRTLPIPVICRARILDSAVPGAGPGDRTSWLRARPV